MCGIIEMVLVMSGTVTLRYDSDVHKQLSPWHLFLHRVWDYRNGINYKWNSGTEN